MERGGAGWRLPGRFRSGSGSGPTAVQDGFRVVANQFRGIEGQGTGSHKPAVLKHQLTGAELYSINCNRCHQERYPTERTAAQWKTIMLHMQVRANIPVSQAKLILQYLQENSGR